MDNNHHNVRQFIAQLFRAAGLDSLSAADREEYQERLAKELETRLGIVALRELREEEDLAEFHRLISQDPVDQSRLLGFFKSRIKDFDERMSDALREFAVEFLDSVQSLRAGI